MKKRSKQDGDARFWSHTAKRRKPIAKAATATSEYLAAVHEQHPRATIRELRDLLNDKKRYIHDPEALAVLDAYIKAGEGDMVPRWW